MCEPPPPVLPVLELPTPELPWLGLPWLGLPWLGLPWLGFAGLMLGLMLGLGLGLMLGLGLGLMLGLGLPWLLEELPLLPELPKLELPPVWPWRSSSANAADPHSAAPRTATAADITYFDFIMEPPTSLRSLTWIFFWAFKVFVAGKPLRPEKTAFTF